jgi:hypothetical protein
MLSAFDRRFAGGRQWSESAMLKQYHCFARRDKRYSENPQFVVAAVLLCMGLFSAFCVSPSALVSL